MTRRYLVEWCTSPVFLVLGLDLHFSGQSFDFFVGEYLINGENRTNSTIAIRQEVRHFTTGYHQCQCCYFTTSTTKKCTSMTFIDVDICHQVGPIRMFCSMTLPYIVKVKLFKWLFLQVNAEIENIIIAIGSHCECCKSWP